MDTQRLWECFCLTGEPLVYLLYQAALDQESGGGISASNGGRTLSVHKEGARWPSGPTS